MAARRAARPARRVVEGALYHAWGDPAEVLGLLVGQADLPPERLGVAVLVDVEQVAVVAVDGAAGGSAQRARPPISQAGRIEYAWSEWAVMYPLICSPELMPAFSHPAEVAGGRAFGGAVRHPGWSRRVDDGEEKGSNEIGRSLGDLRLLNHPPRICIRPQG